MGKRKGGQEWSRNERYRNGRWFGEAKNRAAIKVSFTAAGSTHLLRLIAPLNDRCHVPSGTQTGANRRFLLPNAPVLVSSREFSVSSFHRVKKGLHEFTWLGRNVHGGTAKTARRLIANESASHARERIWVILLPSPLPLLWTTIASGRTTFLRGAGKKRGPEPDADTDD